jgi:uncharacterized protein (TIGR00661 family)
MRILYGVTGEGMGHATRSKVILEHLIPHHQFQVVVSGRAHKFLNRTFPELPVHEIAGLSMVYEDNRVRKRRTFLQLLRTLLPNLGENVATMDSIWENFAPEVCISDFESVAYLFARGHRLPVLSIDNMQIINRCRHDDIQIPEEAKRSYKLAKTIVKGKLPKCDHYLITTFFFPPVRKGRTSLYPPILRDAILEARATATRGDHILVYQTSDTFTELLPTLQALPYKFVIYGLKRDAEMGNVRLKDFSEQGFVDDLKTSRAVLAGGGFSLMGEAVFLGKPLLAVPLEGQFEQTLNALYLQQLGYGEYHARLTGEGIAGFLGNVDKYADNLRGYQQDGNGKILAAVDDLLAQIQEKGRLL